MRGGKGNILYTLWKTRCVTSIPHNVCTHPHLHLTTNEPAAGLFETLLATVGRQNPVRACGRRHATRAELLRLKRARHFVTGVAPRVLASANNERLGSWLSVNTNPAGVFHAKFLLTYGRPYGRMKLNFLGGVRLQSRRDAFCRVVPSKKLVLSVDTKGRQQKRKP